MMVELAARIAQSTDRGFPIIAALMEALLERKFILPAPGTLERAAAAGRARAQRLAADALIAPLTQDHLAGLDVLVVNDPGDGPQLTPGFRRQQLLCRNDPAIDIRRPARWLAHIRVFRQGVIRAVRQGQEPALRKSNLLIAGQRAGLWCRCGGIDACRLSPFQIGILNAGDRAPAGYAYRGNQAAKILRRRGRRGQFYEGGFAPSRGAERA
ncbi:DUF4158 domain-containing protein [Mesorhizobium sp. M1E.F.Ca.ET.045.02.1.1]|uniref:DUF4158 domain-containing protein n=1 Tax=Mesorhizobium sp. M1E.F.Ca.ET.045.02.1.1 TaxID=2493672 RepID=UPI000F75D4F6|nr:DUF4158 domain-containing protein [Mesorhizobium sp. M1E.F.Ca.ET.045.02.1.1]AZO22690.1 DUF4158 domain-containing protein [Mesorhizobium sp. M1E.F.Ca.ET.045.02.1.1]